MNGIELGKIIVENAKKLGIKPIVVKPLYDKEKAEGLREFYLGFYKNHHINGFCNCFEKQKQDIEYNLRAYEMMSNEQILSSEKRDIYLRQKETEDLLKYLKESQIQARENMKRDTRVWGAASVA